MDTPLRTAEDYFNQLLTLIERSSAPFKQAQQFAEQNPTEKRSGLANFIDFYCVDFNDSLLDLLESIGAAHEAFQFEYTLGDDTYRILDTDRVLNELVSNKEMYVARIKEATVFLPHGSPAVWIENLDELEELRNEVEYRFSGINISKAE